MGTEEYVGFDYWFNYWWVSKSIRKFPLFRNPLLSFWLICLVFVSFSDFFKLITYSTFFFLIFSYYGLPFNIVKDVCMVARSFYGKIRDLLRYRAATKNMDQRYPNATPEELGRTDGTCIICREDMVIQGATINPASTTSTTQPQPQPQPPLQQQLQRLQDWTKLQRSCHVGISSISTA